MSELFQAVTARFPGSAFERETIIAFKEDWAKMIKEFGINRFSLGLQRAIMSTSFFPNIADIRKHIPVAEIGYTGWKPTPEDLARKASGERQYGEGDTLALWKMFQEKRAVYAKKHGEPMPQMSEDEIDEMLQELDRRKGKATQAS